MRTGKQVFEIHKEKVLNFIKKKQYDKFWFVIEKGNPELHLTHEFKDLIISMLDYNPNNRPDISDIFNHPWLDEINSLDFDDFLTYEENAKNRLKEIEKTTLFKK